MLELINKNGDYEKIAQDTLKLLYNGNYTNKKTKTISAKKEWTERYDKYKLNILNFMTYNPNESVHWQCSNQNIRLSKAKLGNTGLMEYTSLRSFSKGETSIRYHGIKVGTMNRKNSGNSIFVPNDKKVLDHNFSGLYDFMKDREDKLEAIKDFLKNRDNNSNAIGGERFVEAVLLEKLRMSLGINDFGIQPILLPPSKECGFPYQFPTPLGASNIKKNELKYSGHYGGGIDILARICDKNHKGGNDLIAVIELKDTQSEEEKQKYGPEGPKDAIKQAIAYTTFLAALIEHDRENEQKTKEEGAFWLKLFGKNGYPGRKSVYTEYPKSITYYAVVAYPINNDNEKELLNEGNHFSNKEIIFTNGDKIILHYIFYKQGENNPKKITNKNWISFIK